MKYNKLTRSNLNHLALNRFDNDLPREIWMDEGQHFLTKEPKLSPYSVDIYKAIEYAINEGVIVLDIEQSVITEGTDIEITGTGTTADPYIINSVFAITAEEIKTLYESNDDTNVFTDVQVTKLDGIEDGAQVNVKSDWDEATSTEDAFILNKPTIPTTASEIANVPSGNILSTDVQAALNELQTELNNVAGGNHQNNTESLFIDSLTGTTTLQLVKDTFYEVQSTFTGNGNNLSLNGSNLVNGDRFIIANNTGVDLDVLAVAGTINFSEIDNPLGSVSLLRMKNKTARQFMIKDAGFGSFHHLIHSPLLDEDDMSSNSANFAATQQSVKAYVDANLGGGFTYEAKATSPNTFVVEDNKTYFVNSSVGINDTVLKEMFLDLTSLSVGGQFEVILRDGFPLKLNSTGAVVSFTLQGNSGGGQSSVTLEAGSSYRFAHAFTNGLSMFKIDSLSSVEAHTHLSTEVTDFQTAVTNNASVTANTIKLTANTTNVDNAGAVMNADTSTGSMDFVLDEDDLGSDSPTKLATQQSIKAYVDNQFAVSSGAHTKQKTGKAQYFAKPASTTYSLTNGVGLFTIAEFGDLNSATIIVDRADDSASDNFTLIFDHSDNTVNTWQPDANGSVDHDLYIPQYQIFNALTTKTPLFYQALSDKTTDGTVGIVPEVVFGNGQVQLVFADDNAAWTATQRIVIQVNFIKL